MKSEAAVATLLIYLMIMAFINTGAFFFLAFTIFKYVKLHRKTVAFEPSVNLQLMTIDERIDYFGKSKGNEQLAAVYVQVKHIKTQVDLLKHSSG